MIKRIIVLVLLLVVCVSILGVTIYGGTDIEKTNLTISSPSALFPTPFIFTFGSLFQIIGICTGCAIIIVALPLVSPC